MPYKSVKVEGMHDVEVGPLPDFYEQHCFFCEEDIEEGTDAVLMLHMDIAMCFSCLSRITNAVKDSEGRE